MTRIACGKITRFMVRFGRMPKANAASDWPLLTARIPARTISAMNAPVYSDNAIQSAISELRKCVPSVKLKPFKKGVTTVIPRNSATMTNGITNNPSCRYHVVGLLPVASCNRDARVRTKPIAMMLINNVTPISAQSAPPVATAGRPSTDATASLPESELVNPRRGIQIPRLVTAT